MVTIVPYSNIVFRKRRRRRREKKNAQETATKAMAMGKKTKYNIMSEKHKSHILIWIPEKLNAKGVVEVEVTSRATENRVYEIFE